MATEARTKILFLVGRFPEVSETFVWREALSLNRLGDVEFMSLAEEDYEPAMFPEETRGVLRRMRYRRPGLRELSSVLLEILRHPWAMLRAASMLPRSYSPRSRLARLYALCRVRDCIRREGIGVVHAHWRGPTDVAFLNYRFFGTPFTMFLHAHDIYDEGFGDPDYRPLFSEKVRRAARVFTCTARNVETLRTVFPGAPIELSYHGVSESLLDKPPESGPAEGPLRLLSVGRLIRYKGFADLVPLAAELKRRGIEFTWEVIGDGSLRSGIESQAAEQGLSEEIRVHGVLPNEAVVRAMQRSEILVFLGLQQEGQYGLPNVLLEAAACGLCVISRPLDTIAELIESGETGYVAMDLESIADRIEALHADRQKIRAVGCSARTFVSTRHAHTLHVEQTYRQIAAAGSPG